MSLTVAGTLNPVVEVRDAVRLDDLESLQIVAWRRQIPDIAIIDILVVCLLVHHDHCPGVELPLASLRRPEVVERIDALAVVCCVVHNHSPGIR